MALRSTKPYLRALSIPVSLLAGMFFFCLHASAQNLAFTRELFARAEFDQCRCESKRALLQNSEPREHFQLLHSLAGAQLQQPPEQTIKSLQQIVQENRNPQISAMASYELGRQLWSTDKPDDALNAFAFAFQTTTNQSLFLHAACSSFLLMNEHKELKTDRPDLVDQINTSRSQWYGSLFSECAKPEQKSNSSQKLNWLVRFYRAQISPAIGSRCNMQPSCSEYFNQAWQKHGFLALPMISDRLCREPGVNARQESPVLIDGKIRYADPLENHDFWMKK